MISYQQQAAKASEAVLAMLLEKLGGGQTVQIEHSALVRGVTLTKAGVVLAATTCTLNMFEAEIRAAAEATGKDVILARHERKLRRMAPIFYDVAFWHGSQLCYFDSYFLCCSRDGGLWLMPTKEGPFVELSANGLAFSTVAPFAAAEDHANGILRATERLSFLLWGASL